MWVGFAARGFHYLADEPASDFGIAIAVLLGLVRIIIDQRINHGFDLTGVGDLFETFVLDDLCRITALGDHHFKNILGDAARDRIIGDQADQLAEIIG